jgi:hypothetical protein
LHLLSAACSRASILLLICPGFQWLHRNDHFQKPVSLRNSGR